MERPLRRTGEEAVKVTWSETGGQGPGVQPTPPGDGAEAGGRGGEGTKEAALSFRSLRTHFRVLWLC